MDIKIPFQRGGQVEFCLFRKITRRRKVSLLAACQVIFMVSYLTLSFPSRKYNQKLLNYHILSSFFLTLKICKLYTKDKH